MKNIIIIGNSAAAISAVESLRFRDKDSKISLVSSEDYPAYRRCDLFNYLSGKINETQLVYRPEEFYKENNIDLLLGKRVIHIECKKNQIILEDNQKLGYDSLLITIGAAPKLPPIKGAHKRGVFGLRTIKDAKDILSQLPITKTACVLGGGLMGLKAGCLLKKGGIEVKVIVKSKQILSQVLDKTAADIVQRHLESKGLEILTGLDTLELLGNGDLKAVKLDSGKVIGCELVIIGKGVSPNIGIVKNTEIKVDEGIIVDKFLRTSVENIYAAGDCAQAYDSVLEKPRVNALWPNAVEQGCLAGKNIRGENLIYEGSMRMNALEFFDLPVISMGIAREEEGMKVFSRLDEQNKIYKKIVIKDNRLKGVILLGKTENSDLYLELIKQKADVSGLEEDFFLDPLRFKGII